MSEHCGYVIQIKNLRPHSNADRLQVLEIFGTATCVNLDVKEGDLGIYFPTDLQLSEEFCKANDLVERKDENGEKAGGYLHPIKRNVKCIRLRGEKSDGMYLGIKCLDYLELAETPKVGDKIEILNGHEICRKYIPKSNKEVNGNVKQGQPKIAKKNVAPLFAEHADTEQLPYHLEDFKAGDLVEITLKLHGTSQRTGYLPKLKGYKMTLADKVNNFLGKIAEKAGLNPEFTMGEPIYDWDYVTGTRRTIINDFSKEAYYDTNEFRKEHAQQFEGKLHKGETVYYEVVGFQTNGVPIMAECNNEKTKDKDFIKQYGKTTVFSYGCFPGGLIEDENFQGVLVKKPAESAMYVYRMTFTNEDGHVVDYTPDYMRYRCEQMGVNYVPVMWKGYIPEHCGTTEDDTVTPGEWVMAKAEQYYEGPDPIGKHIREGVVVRIINRPKFSAYKLKNFHFKCVSGIAIAEAEEKGTISDEDMASEM